MNNVEEYQPSLFDLPPVVQPDYNQGDSIEERFNVFHAQNPAIYSVLRSLALDMRRRGVNRWGIKAAIEVVRWQYAIQTNGDEFKLNNNFAPHYARLLMAHEPRLDGFFETRCLRS